MRIEYLKLHNFRNYASLELRPKSALSILVGDNAQGKTNVIEAVFLMAAGRSHRTARDGELVMHGRDGTYARVDVLRADGGARVEMKLGAGGKKQAKVDGKPAQRMGDMIGRLNAVVFSPEDLRLVKDGPAERRKFIDMELSQVRPKYFMALMKYARALSMRNALLKEISSGRPRDEIGAFDEILVECGEEIVNMRGAFMGEISGIARELHASISGGEELEAKYMPDTPPGALKGMLEAGFAEDVRRGATGKGPHKDDISLRMNGADLRSFGSQGQQRTAALALKLSEIYLMKELSGEWPVLLLDDVFSELDGKRQTLLISSIAHCQTLLTCTSAPEGLEGDVYRVRAGTIAREN